jgi:hypothetical protein
MAAFSPFLMRSVSGGTSWASVVATGAKAKAKAKAKNVSWKDGDRKLGVETRVYITDEGHPEFEHTTREQGVSLTKYWGGVNTGGKTVYLKHVPYRAGEMSERTVVIGEENHGDRIGFSQITRKDGSEMTSTIFGRLVSKFIEGVPTPSNGGLSRTAKVGMLSPDFFKTGSGKEFVGDHGLRLKIEEALEKVESGGKYGMIKEACCLEPRHAPTIARFQEAYYSADGARLRAARLQLERQDAEKMKQKSKLNAEASVFVPKPRSADEIGLRQTARAFVLESVGRSDLLENKTGVRFIAPPIIGIGM